MTFLLRHNMPVTTDVKNTPLAARLSSLSGPSSYACVRVSCVSDIMQYGFAAMSLVLLAPLFLIIGQLIRFTSQGPIFYRGLRLGKDRKQPSCPRKGCMHFAVGRPSASAELSSPESLPSSLLRQMLECALPLVKP
jgi:lipopolysaccharide/colanic/teichoic acid biosynthesis glycosyltransferase